MDIQALKELIYYDENTGKLYWKERPVSMFKQAKDHSTWNTANAGKEALSCINKGGYMHGAIFGKFYYAHIVAYALANGAFPKGQIDHINGNKLDNRKENLRVVTARENRLNAGRKKSNTSGRTGVGFEKRRGHWVAQIVVHRKHIYLGSFKSFAEAVAAREAAERHYEFYQNDRR